MKIGSLFSGYGGLDMGVQAVVGGDVAWHVEVDKDASMILAHHWPDVPNLGDISLVDWTTVEPVDVLTGGFPCQDVSHAGKRAGIAPGTRSGLWSEFARAIQALRPSLVVIENVRGLLSARADRGDDVGDVGCELCDVEDAGRPALRALGAVLGDLAELGYDARWGGVRAADAGAPHGRFRVFIVAEPADATGPRLPGTKDGTAGSGDAETRVRRSQPERDCGTRTDFGPYAAAVHRWERILGRPAPPPTEVGAKGQPRLSPRFVEWMMGLPEGHVTGVPISRNAMLKALGNGVVPRQAELALRILLHADTLPTPVSDNDYQSLPNTVAALLPTPSASEPGYSGTLVDEEGDPVAHTAQRTYDPDTGRLVQTGLPRAVALLPTPAVNDMGAGKTVDEWDTWTDRMKAEHGNGNGHGKSLAIEAQRIGGAA